MFKGDWSCNAGGNMIQCCEFQPKNATRDARQGTDVKGAEWVDGPQMVQRYLQKYIKRRYLIKAVYTLSGRNSTKFEAQQYKHQISSSASVRFASAPLLVVKASDAHCGLSTVTATTFNFCAINQCESHPDE